MRSILASVIFVALLATPLMAETGFNLGVPTNPSFPLGGEDNPYVLMDEYNAGCAHSPVGTYSGGCFAIRYDAPSDYVLARVEFLAGGVSGQTFVEIRLGSNSGTLLGTTGNYPESATTGWQGADLQTAVTLTMGTTYYVVYNSLAGGAASTCASGQGIDYEYQWSATCSSYGGSFFIPWKIRYYGDPAVPVEGSTWGMIKSLYEYDEICRWLNQRRPRPWGAGVTTPAPSPYLWTMCAPSQ